MPNCDKGKKIHGMTTHTGKHPLYSVYRAMLDRCYRKNVKSFRYCGARGIGVCSEWRGDPSVFFAWAFSHGYQKGLHLDRIDNDKGYGPENCRWATHAVSARNKRCVIFNGRVVAIIKGFLLQGYKPKPLSRLYGITHQAIDKIRNGTNWREVEPVLIGRL